MTASPHIPSLSRGSCGLRRFAHLAGERVPVLECQTALAEGFAALGAMPGIDEATRRLFLHRTADGDFDVAHLPPRRASASARIVARMTRAKRGEIRGRLPRIPLRSMRATCAHAPAARRGR